MSMNFSTRSSWPQKLFLLVVGSVLAGGVTEATELGTGADDGDDDTNTALGLNAIAVAADGTQLHNTALGDNSQATGNEDASLGVIHLGGYSTVTMPPQQEFARDTERTAWHRTWLPFEIPSDAAASGWTLTTNGGTHVLQAPGELNISNSGDHLYYSDSPSGTADEGIIILAELQVNSGGSIADDSVGQFPQFHDIRRKPVGLTLNLKCLIHRLVP